MTPAEAISMLDAHIARHGQALKIKRGNAATVDLRGFVRGFKPSELVGTLQQGDRSVVLSPSDLAASGIPARLDKMVVAGDQVTVQSVEKVHIADTLVRVNLIVRGS